MNKNHLNRFFKRNKLKPRKLNVNSPELLITNNFKNSSTSIQGKKNDNIILLMFHIEFK